MSKAYEDNYIYVKHEDDNFKDDLVSIIVHLRQKKLDNYIKLTIEMLKNEAENVDDINMRIMYLQEKQKRIAQEIGSVVLTL